MTSSELGALLEELGIDQLRLRNGNWMGCCPVHGERRPSFGIREEPPHVYGCFACSAKGTLYTLLRDHYGWDKAQIEDRIGAVEFSEFSGQFPTSFGKSLVLKYVEEKRLYPFELTDRAIDYGKSRGLTLRTMKTAKLLYDHNNDRLMFPWYYHGLLVGATGRAIRDAPSNPKIIAYFDLNKALIPYLPLGTLEKDKYIILVEGEIDALKVYQAGFRNVAALSFGRMSDGHLSFLRALSPRRVVLFFDRDKTGARLTDDYKQALLATTEVFTVPYSSLRMQGKLDPGMLSPQVIRYLVNRAYKTTGFWNNFSLD